MHRPRLQALSLRRGGIPHCGGSLLRLATVMLLTSQAPGKMLEWIGALSVTMIVCAIVLILAEKIQQWLGERAVTAFERLMGLVLVAISVEMILTGIRTFVHQL